jgi:catechol 2,3-dioxygenase-like lactoylglutathione lyase family enzyme
MSRHTASTMMVIGLHHAGVHVTNLERSVAFYEAVFECERSSDWPSVPTSWRCSWPADPASSSSPMGPLAALPAWSITSPL